MDHGLRVPDDLSLIGLDDIMLGQHVRPSLTTVAIPKHELAQEATQLLLRYIDNLDTEPIQLTLRPYLVIRRSTATAGET